MNEPIATKEQILDEIKRAVASGEGFTVRSLARSLGYGKNSVRAVQVQILKLAKEGKLRKLEHHIKWIPTDL